MQIRLSEIRYIQAEKRYVYIVTQNECYCSRVSIAEIEQYLPANLFCRIHRSFLVSLAHTVKFDNDLAYVAGKKLPIARQYRNALRDAIIVVNGERGPLQLGDSGVEKLVRHLHP